MGAVHVTCIRPAGQLRGARAAAAAWSIDADAIGSERCCSSRLARGATRWPRVQRRCCPESWHRRQFRGCACRTLHGSLVMPADTRTSASTSAPAPAPPTSIRACALPVALSFLGSVSTTSCCHHPSSGADGGRALASELLSGAIVERHRGCTNGIELQR